MARKSKITILYEQMKTMSNCPEDLFDLVEANDDLFDKIKEAETGNIESIKYISEILFKAGSRKDNANAAMIYFLRKGVELGDIKSAEWLVMVAAKKCAGFDLIDKALELIKNPDEKMQEYIDEAKCKKAIAKAQRDNDPEEMLEVINNLPPKQRPHLELYIEASKDKDSAEYNTEKISLLCEKAGIKKLASLSVFGKCDTAVTNDSKASDEEQKMLLMLLGAIEMDEWREFWLKVIYEYTVTYLDSDFTNFAPAIIRSFRSAKSYKKSKLYTLAWMFYAKNSGIESIPELLCEYDDLLQECAFEEKIPVLDNAEILTQVLQESLLHSADERKREMEEKALGNIIKHEKNRYKLVAHLDNHAKRASKHMWTTVISLKTDKDVPPQFNKIGITERRVAVSRGGVTLDAQKGVAQILCMGEIVYTKPIPFELDLILDISYVSTTKCEMCNIKIKSYEKQGDYLVMKCQIYIH